ncbi:MAG: hypothetical protein JWL88_229 [Parcubacteria group bacterium]|nr:hypothetical protein [Parcubacteria group bacterium]
MAAENDPLETLRARLYAPQPVGTVTPERLSHKDASSTTAWTPPPPPVIKPARPKLPLSLWFLIGAGAFFAVAGIIAAVFIILGGRSVSTAHVLIDVQGPTSIASGDTVPILITIKNNNPVPMNAATITVNLPSGTRNPDNVDQSLDQYSDSLGDIAPGTEVQHTVRAVMFGAQNQALTIPIHIEYRTTGSNAVSVKDQNYGVTVTTSPISVNISGLTQVTSGQPVTLRVSVHSNATTPLANISLLGAYPPGFVPTSATPAPTSDSYFALGTFAPGEEKIVTVTGTLTGIEGDQRVFHFTAGTAKDDGTPALGTSYTDASAIVAVAKPLLGLTVSLNRGDASPVTVPAGQPVQGTVSWLNSLTSAVSNAQVTVKFGGSAFDPSSVVAQTGFYRSSDSTIVFDKSSNPGLALLQPNDSGAGSFSFTPKSGVHSPTVTLLFTVTGTRANANGDMLTSTVTRTVQVGTDVTLTSKIEHATGPIANTGPIPPTPNQETTYTVVLGAANSINSVSGAVVTTTLPSYVRFTGSTDAGDTPITYDDSTRTVTWNLNTLAASASKQASFQVAVLPSTAQKGTSPIVIPTQTLTATDQFTRTKVTVSADALTTQTPADPGYVAQKGVVN